MDGWNMLEYYFPFGMTYFQGLCYVSFREGNWHPIDLESQSPKNMSQTSELPHRESPGPAEERQCVSVPCVSKVVSMSPEWNLFERIWSVQSGLQNATNSYSKWSPGWWFQPIWKTEDSKRSHNPSLPRANPLSPTLPSLTTSSRSTLTVS